MEYIIVEENDLNKKKYSTVQTVFLMIRYGKEYLLKREYIGGHWELPATGMESDETPRECIIRNYSKKYNLDNMNIILIGISKVTFEVTKWRPDPQPEYLALFEVEVDEKDKVIQNLDKDLHIWYTIGDDISPYCQLCRELIQDHNFKLNV